ncbi:MAG: aminotransferase class I/II-fold pyridoxal phosphate-dependent enzyme [Solirubrobacteraceae bacterium]
MLDIGQYQISGSTAIEIASSAEVAILEGALDPGETLPTIRALAQTLGTSPATISSAYRILRHRGLVVAQGRRGTHVAARPTVRFPEPARRGAPLAGRTSHLRDLASGLPDPTLLPPLAPVLARIDFDRRLRMSELETADPELIELAAASFEADGLPSGALAITAGAFDAIERVLGAHLRPGDRVIIEDPTYVSIRDLLLALGLVEVPVPVDECGMLPARLEVALARGAAAVLIVPRAQNPFGSALDPERTAALRGLLEGRPEVLLIEDDHTGSVSGAPFSTLVAPSRRSWAVVRSTSKLLHPDLRLALVAGDHRTISRVEGRQALGPRWVSHISQAIVAELLGDPEHEALLARARDAYAWRRDALLRALSQHGIQAHGRSGLNVWVPVREEAPVFRALQDAGWLVRAGERFRIETPPGIRVTVATLTTDEAPALAQDIASAEQAGRPRRAY